MESWTFTKMVTLTELIMFSASTRITCVPKLENVILSGTRKELCPAFCNSWRFNKVLVLRNVHDTVTLESVGISTVIVILRLVRTP